MSKAISYLIQLLLPLYDGHGASIAQQLFDDVRSTLVEKFGGLTAYNRAPATGLWKDGPAPTVQDEIVVYEVMAEQLDVAWWAGARREWCEAFGQEELVCRAFEVRLL